jgi:hypothetical protein
MDVYDTDTIMYTKLEKEMYTVIEGDVELKARLERTIGRKVPWITWRKLSGFGGPIEQYRERSLEPGGSEQDNFLSLQGIVKDELKYLDDYEQEKAATSSQNSGMEPRPAPAPEEGVAAEDWVFDAYERARARAISEYMALYADQHPAVIEFRKKSLGGNLLTLDAAHAFLETSRPDLENLSRLGSHLADLYPGWGEQGAMLFVLTGQAPNMQLIKTRGTFQSPRAESYAPFWRHTVTLSITPWISPETVERLYRHVRRMHITGERRKGKPRTIETACFAWEQYRLEGKRLSWRVLCQRWNDKHPDQRFEEWRHFREYAKRGVTATLSL